MNCKPGDLAICIRALNPECKFLIGKIVKVSKLSINFSDSWLTDPPVFTKKGERVSFQDRDLVPISGLPMGEETEQKLKEPA